MDKTNEKQEKCENEKNDINEKQEKCEKTKRKYSYISIIFGIFLLISFSLLWFVMQKETPHNILQTKNTQISKVDKMKVFKNIWNEKIYTIKYDNSFLNINFNKYTIKNSASALMNKLTTFDQKASEEEITNLQKSKYKDLYLPKIRWLEMRKRFVDINYDDITDSTQMMEYLAHKINPQSGFSDATIDTIIQANNFCYFFELNRIDFYRDGYSKNIKSCKDIEKF